MSIGASYHTTKSPTNGLIVEGNVGVGFSSPSHKLHVNGNIAVPGGNSIYIGTNSVADDFSSGINWHVGNNDYYIRRTAGGWNSPNYQQLKLQWATGIILGAGGGAYGRSFVGVDDRMSIGSSYYATKPPDNGLLVEGKVGIGTTSPVAKLEVTGGYDVGFRVNSGGAQIFGTETSYNYPEAQNDYLTNNTNVVGDAPYLPFGLYVQNTVRAAGIVVFSDRRIKSNVVDIDDTTALDQVRLLKPKYYEYVDKVKRGGASVIGMIAQDVKEIIPRAVSISDGDIPNIYETATISSSNTVTFTNFNTSDLDGLGKLIAYLAEDKREELTITEVLDEHTVQVEEDLGHLSDWGSELFVWGQKVQDFHHLNKDYIAVVTTTALQQVDRELQAEKARNDLLEERILKLETVILNL